MNFFNIIQLPGNEGYLGLDDKLLENLQTEDYPSLASVYEHENLKETFIDYALFLGEPDIKEDLKKIEREVKRKKNIFSVCMEISTCSRINHPESFAFQFDTCYVF